MAIEYQKGAGFLYRLDARTKLLLFGMMTVVTVLIIDPIIQALLFVALYFVGLQSVNRKLLNDNLRILVVIFLTFSLFQVVFFPNPNGYFLFNLIPFTNWVPVTAQSLLQAVAVFFRFFSVVLAVHLMLYTTPPVDLALTITKHERKRRVATQIFNTILIGVILFIVANLTSARNIHFLPSSPVLHGLIVLVASLVAAFAIQAVAGAGLPPEMGMALTLGLGTVGLLSKQTEIIGDAQKARGYNIRPRNLVRRVQVLVALLLPIFLATLERSQDISVAILSRGFDYQIDARTYRRQLEFGVLDYLVIFVLIMLFVGALYLNYANIGNPTEKFILSFLK